MDVNIRLTRLIAENAVDRTSFVLAFSMSSDPWFVSAFVNHNNKGCRIAALECYIELVNPHYQQHLCATITCSGGEIHADLFDTLVRWSRDPDVMSVLRVGRTVRRNEKRRFALAENILGLTTESEDTPQRLAEYNDLVCAWTHGDPTSARAWLESKKTISAAVAERIARVSSLQILPALIMAIGRTIVTAPQFIEPNPSSDANDSNEIRIADEESSRLYQLIQELYDADPRAFSKLDPSAHRILFPVLSASHELVH